MRRRLLFVAALMITLVAGLASGADRPAETALHGAKRPQSAPSEAAGARRLREAAARLHPERRPARPARPLRGAGGRLELLLHAHGRPCSRSAKGKRGSRASARLPRRQPGRRRSPARAASDGQGQLPARQRPGPLAHEPADLRRDRLPRPLAGDRPAPPRRGRAAEVRVPRSRREPMPPGSASPTAASERLSLGRGGELRIETALGLLRDSRPVSYQPIGGRRVAVESRFVLGRARRLRLRRRSLRPPLPARHRPRPRLLHLPGRKQRRRPAIGVAVDGAGSAYVTGSTCSADFPTTAGAFDTTYNGGTATPS